MTTTRKYEETCRMICQNGYRSSSMDWLMKVFQNIETFPVLLMSYLWSREQKWYRVNITFLLTSRKTGSAVSVWGRKLQGLLAEDAPVQSCLEPSSRKDVGHFWDLVVRKVCMGLMSVSQMVNGTELQKSWCSTLLRAGILFFVPPVL